MGAAPSIRGLSEQTHRLQLLLGSFGQLGQVQAVDKEGDGNGEEGRGQTREVARPLPMTSPTCRDPTKSHPAPPNLQSLLPWQMADTSETCTFAEI